MGRRAKEDEELTSMWIADQIMKGIEQRLSKGLLPNKGVVDWANVGITTLIAQSHYIRTIARDLRVKPGVAAYDLLIKACLDIMSEAKRNTDGLSYATYGTWLAFLREERRRNG